MMNLLTAKKIIKSYTQGSRKLQILNELDLEIRSGERIVILGQSGSGKSTVLSILSGLDTSDSGTVSFKETPLNSLSPEERTAIRANHFGFVFQQFRLIPYLTALENVCLPFEWNGKILKSEQQKWALELLNRVGLSERLDHLPEQLSGGEMQRVALARALVTKPDIVFADEPSGNLDQKTGTDVMDLLFHETQPPCALVLVTHNEELAKRCDRIFKLENGKLRC